MPVGAQTVVICSARNARRNPICARPQRKPSADARAEQQYARERSVFRVAIVGAYLSVAHDSRPIAIVALTPAAQFLPKSRATKRAPREHPDI
jgi:hypothetical protein